MEENKVIEENTKVTKNTKKKPSAKKEEKKNTALPDSENEESSLELLALEPETIEDSHESAEESADYASFLASYNALMADRLALARAAQADAQKEDESTDGETVAEPEAEPEEAPTEESAAAESTDEDTAPEEVEEVEIIVKQDIEFHKEIVSKSERVNAEDYIVLVPQKESDSEDDIPEDVESVYETQEIPAEPADEVQAHSESYEEYEKEAQLAPETLEYDPNQISMMLGEESKEQPADPSRYDEKHPRIVDHLFDIVEMLVLTLTAAIVITSIFFRFSFVDGHSMDRTLNDGDTLIISNLFYTPDYGDIVVIEYENNIHEVKPLIKRVIGLPGDVIKINRLGDVYRNGVLLDESEYVYNDGCSGYFIEGEWHVGEDEIFVMGDHRDDSKDSRDIGPVKINTIIGHAVFRLFPLKDIGLID